MGQIAIVVHLTGQHHNYKTKKLEAGDPNPHNHPLGTEVITGQDPKDADLMAAEFVKSLKAAGHHVSHAAITHGGSTELTSRGD